MSRTPPDTHSAPEPEPVDGDLEHLQEVVSLGQYKVDCDEVARAILDRINARIYIRERGGDRVLRRALTDLQAV